LVVVMALLAGACSRSDDAEPGGEATNTTSASSQQCEGVALEATDTGVTADTITIQVMADIGSPLAPGLFQGNVDAVKGFEQYINDNGGIGCRQLKVETWDSKLDANEGKNGQINACRTALAMVGDNALFNPDVTEMDTCADASGQPVGIPNVTALANDINERCATNTYSVSAGVETCPAGGGAPSGMRTFTVGIPQVPYGLSIEPDLVGLYMVPGDLPTTVQSATWSIAAQAEAGVEWAEEVKVSGRDEQAAYTPRIQAAAAAGVNYVYNGSNDAAMISIRREAAVQNFSPTVWMCSISCYTERFKAATDMDGTRFVMPFLPFEDKGANQELDNYLDSVATPDSFGAMAWQAAVLFQQAVNDVVESKGPNGITRANLLEALSGITSFDANGWIGAMNPKGGVGGTSDCTIWMEMQGGEFVRVKPTEKGTFDCDPGNVLEVELDPATEAAKIQ
jgi:ABC-type branched-subunit amino acid transport system substrate-binding protein